MQGAFPRDRVLVALRKSWSLRTSSKWTADNPAAEQCSVTALLIEALFGGEILKTPLPDGDHFYNRIDGQRADLTDSQFDVPIVYVDLPSDRREALTGATVTQYEALRTAFGEAYAAR